MALSRRTGQRFQASIWPGFVDAMTGLLLVLMFVLTIFMVVQSVLRETISGQESELDELSAEVAALANALGLEERANAQLTARMGALNSTLSETRSDLQLAQDQIRDQEARILSLIGERDSTQAALSAAETRITSFEAQVAALIADRNSGLAQIAELQSQRETLLSEQQALNLALATARGEIDAQVEQARLAAARREALEAMIADLQATEASQQTELSRLEAALNAEEAARLTEAAAAEALRARLQDADAELTAMTLALETQRQEAEDTLTLLAAADAAKVLLDQQLADTLTELESLQGAAEERDALVAQLEQAQTAQGNADLLQKRLAAALADQAAAEGRAAEQLSLAEARAALLAQAQAALAEEEGISAKAQREAELLNQQIAALRDQLGGLRAILDDYQERDAAQQVQLQNLGQDLNAALARAASEERRRRMLEEQERRRLEAEAEALANRAEDLERYRSEFFGRLREVLGNQEGVRIEGDRFVFASEVLFALGSAELSPAGQREIAKVAQILTSVASDIPAGLNWIIRVDGHTDNQPFFGTGKYADNWELSQGRALSVVRYMIEQLGIPPNRLAANGFGEFQPINPDNTPVARAQNRRIELKLTEK